MSDLNTVAWELAQAERELIRLRIRVQTCYDSVTKQVLERLIEDAVRGRDEIKERYKKALAF